MIQANNLTNKVLRDPIYFLAFGFGSGLMPKAPGTFGTLAALPFYFLLHSHWLLYLLFMVWAFFFGIWISERVTRELGIEDYKGIVWDEIVGYLLTLFLAPSGLLWLLIGFVLFRLFDIWKPYPIRLVDEKVPGGIGIMLDDLLAAIPAWGILQLLVWSFHVK